MKDNITLHIPGDNKDYLQDQIQDKYESENALDQIIIALDKTKIKSVWTVSNSSTDLFIFVG